MIRRNWRQTARNAHTKMMKLENVAGQAHANMRKLEDVAGKAQANVRKMEDAYHQAKAIGPQIFNAHMTTITGTPEARQSVRETLGDPGMSTQEQLDEIAYQEAASQQPQDLSSPFSLNAFAHDVGHGVDRFKRESGYNAVKAGMDRSAARAGAAILHEREKIREGHFPFFLAGVILLIVILLVDSLFVTFLQTWMRMALVLLIVGAIAWKIMSPQKAQDNASSGRSD